MILWSFLFLKSIVFWLILEIFILLRRSWLFAFIDFAFLQIFLFSSLHGHLRYWFIPFRSRLLLLERIIIIRNDRFASDITTFEMAIIDIVVVVVEVTIVEVAIVEVTCVETFLVTSTFYSTFYCPINIFFCLLNGRLISSMWFWWGC